MPFNSSTMMHNTLAICVLIFALLNVCTAQSLCSCSCCIGVGCTASNVGSASASSCDSCDSACRSTYRNSCPASGESGVVSTSCGSGSPPPSTQSANWAGTYSVSSGCDTRTCCCLTGNVQVQQAGLDISISGNVEGVCGGSTSWTPVFALSGSTSSSATFTYLGNNYRVTKSGRQVSVDNLSAPQCSGQATCTSGPCSAASVASVSLIITALVALLAL